MNPTEKIIRTLEGEIFDTVPTFLAGIEDRTFYEVLGQPLIHNAKLMLNPIGKVGLNLLKNKITPLLQVFVSKGMEMRIEAAVKLGFDSTWGIYDETFIGRNATTMYRYTGSVFELREDGFGNLSYYYLEPAIHSPEEFRKWPFWPDPEKLANKTYKFYKKMVKKYGDQICIMGQGPTYGIFESLLWTLGFGTLAKWIRKEKELIWDYISKCETIMMKCMMAMLDAGVKVIFQTDDMGFKTGAMMSPQQYDFWFGPSYTRLTKAVHDRGGKYIQHSCGDNTQLFPYFIKWGIDGVHAMENTCTMNIVQMKKTYGDCLTFLGGIGIDYYLSDKSTDEEVQQHIRDMILKLASGGRYIVGPVHSESTIPADKLRLLLSTVKNTALVPISVNHSK